jgi:hypothetical protein
MIRSALHDHQLTPAPRELPWLDCLEKALDAPPPDEPAFIDRMLGQVDCTRFVAADYDLA